MGKQLKQKRSLDFNNINISVKTEDGKKKIRGHASVFDSPSNNPLWGDKKEIIGRSAFNKTLKENKDIKSLYNHNTDKVLGSLRAETMNINIDDTGLYFEIEPAEKLRSYEEDLIISLERGDISGCSFGFVPIKAHYETRNGHKYVVIDELKLLEISLTPFPAYDQADADFRNEEKSEEKNTIEVEDEKPEPASEEIPGATQDQPEEPTDNKAFWDNEMLILKLKEN